MILQTWEMVRRNVGPVVTMVTLLVACVAFIARTEEAVKKVPQLEKAVLELKEIHAKQQGREEGIQEGERRAIEKLCAAGKLDAETCAEIE